MFEHGRGAWVGVSMTLIPNREEGKETGGKGGRGRMRMRGRKKRQNAMMELGDVFRAGDPGSLASEIM